MITPITDLAENTVFLTKIFHISGNTIYFAPDKVGDWTQMKTKKWPIIFIPIIILLGALPYVYSSVFIYPGTGHNTLKIKYEPNIKLDIFLKKKSSYRNFFF